MDILKTAREIGFYETAINVQKVGVTETLREKVGTSFPLPPEDVMEDCTKIAKWLLSFNKSKYMFTSPEIALIEEMAKYAGSGRNFEVGIIIPNGMEAEIAERLHNNLPANVKISLLEAPYCWHDFRPDNGMVVTVGYLGREHVMVLFETQCVLGYIRGFMGCKVFIPYAEESVAERYEGWIETNASQFKEMWRKGVYA